MDYYSSLSIFALVIVLAPLLGASIAGIYGNAIGPKGAHWVTIIGMSISFLVSLVVFKWLVIDNVPAFEGKVYTWGSSGSYRFTIGFLIDRLSATLVVVVNFISLLVHIYSIGYMRDDPGYQRFFCYMSLFTFAMLTLVLADNFLQLYFGWEGVGLVSYLLIGFWFQKESANFASLKAFLVNRVGDLGFLLGIACILAYFNTLDYGPVFAQASLRVTETIQIWPGLQWSVITVICILLFIGAMAKSAQMPLHVWLPDSMEGPTPISALIHAATMVTAGIFMVARMSPLFEYSPVALSVVMVVGATGALFTGLIAFVQNDIKRIIAYSTLSQLGYMVAGLGASAFAASIFHLMTHACFKALLFLAAGSVIIALHHEQNIRKMGGLWKRLPITYGTFLIGALSMSAIPPFAGFYSKESIIEAVHASTIPGSSFAYVCVLLGTFVTAFYIFRALILTFHTEPRMDKNLYQKVKESPWVMLIPLIMLAIPSIILGGILIGPILFAHPGLLGSSIMVLPQHGVLHNLAAEYAGPWSMTLHAIFSLPVWLAVLGIASAWVCYIGMPELPKFFVQRFRVLYKVLVYKYGFDDFNQLVFVRGTLDLARWLYRVTDEKLIDNGMINGSGRVIAWLAQTTRKMQSGYLYHYALIMVIGILFFMAWSLNWIIK